MRAPLLLGRRGCACTPSGAATGAAFCPDVSCVQQTPCYRVDRGRRGPTRWRAWCRALAGTAPRQLLVVGYMFETPTRRGSARGTHALGVGQRNTRREALGQGVAACSRAADAPDMPPDVGAPGTRQSTPVEGPWGAAAGQTGETGAQGGASAPCLGNLSTPASRTDLEQGGGYGPQYRDASVHLRAVNADHDLAEGAVPGGGRGYWIKSTDRAVELRVGFLTRDNWLIL